MLKYEISYIDKDGNKVDNQIFTAENVSGHLKNLEDWGCHDIHVKSIESEENKKELPTEYSIDLSTYYMDDYDSSHELGDWIADYLKDEFGKEPFSFDYDVEEDEYESTAFVKDIVWDKPKAESLDEDEHNGKYVWKKLSDGDDWYLVQKGEKNIEENFVLCLSRLNRYFPWSVYDQNGERKDIASKVLNNIEDEKVGSYKDYILAHLDELLSVSEEEPKIEPKEEPKTEEALTEAPDDDGIMSDDDLDAEEQRERDEMEARFKARRDKVAQQRTERDAKIARQNELKAQAETKLKEIGNDWQFEHLFDVLVPDSGKCDTLAGELIRAVNKIEYRWFNDGDRFFEDYGIETCGQPAYFLMNFELDDATPLWDFMIDWAESGADNDDYDAMIEDLKNKVIAMLKEHPELLATETKDMYDIASKDEVEEFFEDHDMIPKYDIDCSIPQELESHIDKGNVSERDVIWEIESWIENIGDAKYSNVTIDWGNVYVNDCNKAVYMELDGGSTLYKWLEDYAQELTNEHGDPNEEDDEDDWAESIADELGQDVDMVQNVLDTHSFDSYDDALEYVKNLIEEESEEDEEQ